MNTLEYGYGHTKEAAALVREALKEGLKRDMKPFGLKISVRKADSGYGGPRVEITTSVLALDKRYEYIVNSDGSGIGDGPGKLESKPVSEFTYGRPHHSARLVTPELTEKLNKHIQTILSQFGKDEDDAMTDYFNNTMPLFYGVQYKETK
jgi:hypothetical protein